VLDDLAPHLQAELLPKALDAAAAIPDGSSRAHALAALAPRLPAELLPKAFDAAPKTKTYPKTLVALLNRSQDLLMRSERPAYIRQLRDCLNGTDRRVFSDVLIGAAPAIADVGGTEAIEQCTQAVIDAYRWWP
jgi:hypothetical protein